MEEINDKNYCTFIEVPAGLRMRIYVNLMMIMFLLIMAAVSAIV